MTKVPKISFIFPEKRGGRSWFFLPADKRKSFLEVDRITLRVPSQTCPKYPNIMFVISLQYLKENIKDEVNLLPV